MKTTASVILVSLVLFGLIFVLEQDEPPYLMPGKELGEGYWGEQCEVGESGYLTCKTRGGLVGQTCVALGQEFRLKLNPGNFREQPIVLEVSLPGSERTSSTEILIGEAYGEGTGVCYTEGYKFPAKNILLDRGSNCGPASTPSADPEGLMFYLDTDSEKLIPCIATAPN
ncbi:hypothetical protein N9M22_04760 [Litoricolaceae bacterium]|nr:hypothetical protein [Litorivicinaceae bacterium]